MHVPSLGDTWGVPMEEKTENGVELKGFDSPALRMKPEDGTEFSVQMEAARIVMEEYKETLQGLADS
jgi:hypothetical protein